MKVYENVTLNTSFQLNVNNYEDTLFIVDESSMISNQGLSGNMFGTGRLLDDLITYVYSSKSCSLLLLGDSAQLPPVGEYSSPALLEKELESYNLKVTPFTLKTVMRQTYASGILYNATQLRNMLPEKVDIPVEIMSGFKFKLSGFTDVVRISGQDLIESISQCYGRDGVEETIVLCRSNIRANRYNMGIRQTVLFMEEQLTRGDKLMIVKNCYQFLENVPDLDFIANGDVAELVRIGNYEERYGLHFAQATLRFPDYNNVEIDAKVILDTLTSVTPSLDREQQQALFEGVYADYSDITIRKKRMEKVREDKYFNALQIKYAAAITGHKSQGGQWKCVFVDNNLWKDDISLDDKKWLYTAMTRAVEKVYMVNFADRYFE